ncbi:MAG: hypothetical protein AAGU11_08400 [Syntrophobacteraceae bacterium]
MLIRNIKSRIVLLSLVAAVMLGAHFGPLYAEVTPREREAFLSAIEDTKRVAGPNKVCLDLLAIVPPPGWDRAWPEDPVNKSRLNGGKIAWEGTPGQSRVKVAAFMSREDYESYYKDNLESGQPSYSLAKSLWVSVVPELRRHFIQPGTGTCPPSPKRVLKLLGLNPGRQYDVIVEMFVDPKDLFRPSPDPEITDHKAEIAVQDENGNWIFPSPFVQYATEPLYVSGPGKPAVSFRDWYTSNAIDAYDVDIDKGWGVPWTRLGYTYDWGNPRKRIGLSEFIIRVHPDPSGTGGAVTVKLVGAIKSYEDNGQPANWNNYWRCGAKR